MALAADNMYYIAGAHLDSRGVGRIARSGTTFQFDPLEPGWRRQALAMNRDRRAFDDLKTEQALLLLANLRDFRR
jgi:hypothetical protein